MLSYLSGMARNIIMYIVIRARELPGGRLWLYTVVEHEASFIVIVLENPLDAIEINEGLVTTLTQNI